MKKLVFALTLMAFTMSAAVVVARDQNWNGLQQAWKEQQAQEKKQAAAEKAAAETAKASSAQNKSKNER